MGDQQDLRDAEVSCPIREGGIKDVKEGSRKLNIKMSFRTLSSPRKADKGRLEHNSMALLLEVTLQFSSDPPSSQVIGCLSGREETLKRRKLDWYTEHILSPLKYTTVIISKMSGLVYIHPISGYNCILHVLKCDANA
jgi:hypothetical protein